MLKIRLRRMGSRHKPFFRVVVSEGRNTPLASAVEEIGFYDPRQDPVVISIDTERVDYWRSKGARLSPTVSQLVDKAKASPEPSTAAATETSPEAAAAATSTEAAPQEAAEA